MYIPFQVRNKMIFFWKMAQAPQDPLSPQTPPLNYCSDFVAWFTLSYDRVAHIIVYICLLGALQYGI